MPKILNLVGKRFGHLLVTGKTEYRKNGRVVWDCVCDCGCETRKHSKSLLHSTSEAISCGCKRKKAA